MNWNEIFQALVLAVVLPAVAMTVKVIAKSAKEYCDKLIADKTNGNTETMLTYLNSVVHQCVVTVTQIYVDSLKSQGAFDEAAQKIAFNKAKDMVIALLSHSAKEFINEHYGDVNLWLDSKIEETVQETKAKPKPSI